MRLKYLDIGAHQAEPCHLLSVKVIAERCSCDFDGTSMGLHFVATKQPEKGGKMPLFAA